MQAKVTFYKGIRFKSSLEARWAQRFDELNIEWVYEPKKFLNKDGTCYTPDFFINNNYYIETKCSWENWISQNTKIQKANLWKTVKETGIKLFAVVGYPYEPFVIIRDLTCSNEKQVHYLYTILKASPPEGLTIKITGVQGLIGVRNLREKIKSFINER